MTSSRRQLLWGFCIVINWIGVTGDRVIPDKARNFPKCSQSDKCPSHSTCVETTSSGDYCACDNGFFNDKERLTITYPKGQCTVFCPKQPSSSPCACYYGSVKRTDDKGLFFCKAKCEKDEDCPEGATCGNLKCLCSSGLCNSKFTDHCDDEVKLDEKCAVWISNIRQPTQGNSLTAGQQITQSAFICPKKGSSSPCTCGPGFIKAKNEKGLHFCQDKCNNDAECPRGATCRGNNCYCSEYLCNSKIVSQCIKLLTLDEECIEFTTTTQQPSTTTPLVTEPKTTQSDLTSTTVLIAQTTPSGEMSTTAAHTSISTTLHITSRETSTSPQRPQTTQAEKKRCQSHYSKELEECNKSMNRDVFCNLLQQNAIIQETSCHTNVTNISVQEVANEFTEILNQTNLNNMTTSQLRSAVISIVETVETSLLVTFSKEPQNQNISTPELEVHMKTSIDICDGRGDTSITLTVLGNTMQVPCSHVSGIRDGAIFISYKGLDSSLLGTLGENDHKDREEINSPIISGAITSPKTENLHPPVTFYLKQQKDVPASFILQCVFLDTELKIWSSRGCETKKSDRVNNTLCVCNHLSTFAVLMAPGDIKEDFGLVLISRIGLGLSLVCLCLSLLTFILCQSIKSAHTSVLKALCVCLFLGQLLALLGLHQTGIKILCAVIAGLLQFSFLCAFCWMSLESALLFMTVRNLQAMNYMTSRRSLFPYACLAGFGIPLIIIIISAAIRPDGYGTEKYCWLNQDLVWSFLGPVCGFITINFILLVLTFVLLKKKLASLNTNVSTLKHTRLLTFKAVSQLFILGCTWIIGIFQFGSGSLVMSYIFTICNSLQGLYIFCVHCLLNHQVREEYRRGFRRFQSKKSDSEALSGSTIPMTIKSQSQASEVPTLEGKSMPVVENQYEP